MAVAAALIFTAEGREADTDKMKACRKLLNKKTRLLSNLRDIVELVILSKMSLAESPEKYLEDFLAVYNSIIKGKFLENDYMALASVLILDQGLQNDCDEIIVESIIQQFCLLRSANICGEQPNCEKCKIRNYCNYNKKYEINI